MNDPVISLFIDDELSLEDKINFVEKISSSPSYKDETIRFLYQEKLLRSEVVEHTPILSVQTRRKRLNFLLRPLVFIPSAAAIAATILLILSVYVRQPDATVAYRFVIYRPDIKRAEITGSFTGWKKIPMERIGASGYWQVTLEIPRIEHRFTYIVDGQQRFVDPTIPAREEDDFGGENSVLNINGRKV